MFPHIHRLAHHSVPYHHPSPRYQDSVSLVTLPLRPAPSTPTQVSRPCVPLNSIKDRRRSHSVSIPLGVGCIPSKYSDYFGTAYCCVQAFAVAMAACSSSFQLFATSAASGSSGFGAPRSAWMDSRIVRICSAGDQLSDDPSVLCQHTHGLFS